MNEKETGLAPVEQGALTHPSSGAFTLTPSTLTEALQFSKLIASSELCPKGFRGKPQDVLICIQMGAEMAIPPMQSLQNIAVINGRPTMWGDLVLALIRRSGHLEYMKERDPQEALEMGEGRCEVKRKGDPESIVRTFTVEMAEKAGLIERAGRGQYGDGPWITYRGRMLQMRARSWAVRDAFPDVLKGVAVREEVEDYIDVQPVAPLALPTRTSDKEIQDFVTEGKAPTLKGQKEGKPKPAAPPPKKEEKAPQGETWTGVIEGVESVEGFYRVKGTGDMQFVTDDLAVVKLAGDSVQTGAEMLIRWKLTPNKNREIIVLEPVQRKLGD